MQFLLCVSLNFRDFNQALSVYIIPILALFLQSTNGTWPSIADGTSRNKSLISLIWVSVRCGMTEITSADIFSAWMSSSVSLSLIFSICSYYSCSSRSSVHDFILYSSPLFPFTVIQFSDSSYYKLLVDSYRDSIFKLWGIWLK